jgi:hypothetical protein
MEALKGQEFFKASKDLKSVAKGAWRKVKNYAKLVQAAAKPMAELYLWYRYVAKPTIKDIGELAKLTDKVNKLKKELAGKKTCRANKKRTESIVGYDIQSKTCAKVVLARGHSPQVMDSPWAYGLNISLSNLWDLLSYSFVVDWVLNISSNLAEMDFVLQRNLFRLHYIIASNKLQCDIVFTKSAPITGTLTVIDYHRFGMPTWPSPELDFTGRPTLQYATAGAALAVLNFERYADA